MQAATEVRREYAARGRATPPQGMDYAVDTGLHGLGTRPSLPAYPVDLIELHESIANLLAAQENWEGAYAHLQTALRLARDHDCTALRLPEQHQREVAELRKAHEQALDASMRDELTATYNRRYLHRQLVDLLTDQVDIERGVAIALIDLDHFKDVNDTYGHALGDSVLQRVVSLLQVDLPDGGFCARYGGEEFVLVLPNISARQAVTTLERTRARVADHPWSALAGGLHVTISAGLVHHATHSGVGAVLPETDDAERQLRRADDLLYAAKRSGRNTVAYRKDGAIRLAGLDDNCR
ncbi:diguanylate cyclase (GGDEF) domain-containing protein [Haloechinothrix alba]|uniref:Diguanylate cyclase (GGDEF) domain-containing protein n=1 Tax=Haloechinothrix alba TaxID=664784 RepID=A0A238W750_9PSEU|nr:diguanylate cyclase (GGDEF) domain-containing protein [Haloechinothrix alba]